MYRWASIVCVSQVVCYVAGIREEAGIGSESAHVPHSFHRLWNSSAANITLGGNKKESWSEDCYGYWSPWSECGAECYKTKIFFLAADHCEGYEPWPNESEVFKLCFGEKCPLPVGGNNTQPFLRTFRDTIMKHGLHTGLLDSFGHILEAWQIVPTCIIGVSILSLACVHSIKIPWMPDIGVAIVVAAIMMAVVRFVGFDGINFGGSADSIFGVYVYYIMNTFLIPISIFEGAYHVQQRNFWSQFGYGLLFAVFGTIISTVFIAGMVKYTGDMGLHPVDDWRQAFAYAAFIADVDPVATLSIFSQLKVDALLATLVAGEATLNDPIALVVFNACNVKAKDAVEFNIVDQSKGAFILLFGSIALGCCLGLVMTLFLSIVKRGNDPLPSLYIFICAYVGYQVGEQADLSGIIVTLFEGLIMGIYSARSIKHNSAQQQAVSTFLSVSARFADIVIFVLIGMGTFLINTMAGVKLGLLTVVFCIVSRGLMIIILVSLANTVKYLRGYETINFGRAFMMFHSGLRGGLTVMMALMLDPYWAKDKGLLVEATIVTVIAMAFLCGCTGPFFLRITGVPVNVSQEDGALEDSHSWSSQMLAASDKHISVWLSNSRADQSTASDAT